MTFELEVCCTSNLHRLRQAVSSLLPSCKNDTQRAELHESSLCPEASR